MSVEYSAKFKALAEMDTDAALGKMARFVMLQYFTKYAVKDFANMPWPQGLSAAYAKFKAAHGAKPFADLALTGHLRREFLITTPRSITVKGATAEATLSGGSVPYAAFVNEGTRKMVQRKFVLIAEHADELSRDLDEAINEILGVA